MSCTITAGDALTPRECEVVHLVAKALPNKQIAHALGLSEGTIKEYLNRIFRKLGMSSRTELAIWQLNRKEQ